MSKYSIFQNTSLYFKKLCLILVPEKYTSALHECRESSDLVTRGPQILRVRRVLAYRIVACVLCKMLWCRSVRIGLCAGQIRFSVLDYIFCITISQCFSKTGYNQFNFILSHSLPLAKCSYNPSFVGTVQLSFCI